MGSKERKQAQERAAALAKATRREMSRMDIEQKFQAKLDSLQAELDLRLRDYPGAASLEAHMLWHAREVKKTKEARATLLKHIGLAA